ncbi:biopolymer transporter ExbD/TolR [Synergistales bacterium]|nr:biopolymer transporter ExbD/TolR [Synergistales bacterium]
MRRRTRRAVDIDITPLLDVMFMLIIFFVLTTAFVRGALDIELPKGDAAPLESNELAVITVAKDSSILWNGEKVTLDSIAPRVREAVSRGGDILIEGDSAARYGSVAELLAELRGLGVKNVSLSFEDGAAGALK